MLGVTIVVFRVSPGFSVLTLFAAVTKRFNTSAFDTTEFGTSKPERFTA